MLIPIPEEPVGKHPITSSLQLFRFIWGYLLWTRWLVPQMICARLCMSTSNYVSGALDLLGDQKKKTGWKTPCFLCQVVLVSIFFLNVWQHFARFPSLEGGCMVSLWTILRTYCIAYLVFHLWMSAASFWSSIAGNFHFLVAWKGSIVMDFSPCTSVFFNDCWKHLNWMALNWITGASSAHVAQLGPEHTAGPNHLWQARQRKQCPALPRIWWQGFRTAKPRQLGSNPWPVFLALVTVCCHI